MVGITSFSGYIPRYRLTRKTILEAMGWLNSVSMHGEKAVANFDEDSITMAVASSIECLKGIDRNGLGGLFFASVTSPYCERECAAIIANALDLKPNIRTADFSNSLKGGTAALMSACEAVESGRAKNILVCASDCRSEKPGSPQELTFGDGAASLLIGTEGVIASLEGSYSVSYDFPDYWRSGNDKFDRTLEERWVRDEGYGKFISEAISGLLKKYKLTAKDFAKVIYPCLFPREHAAIGKRLEFDLRQIQEPLYTTVGDTGTASSLMMLVDAIEEGKADDNILIIGYGSGAQALFFNVRGKIEQNRNGRSIKVYVHSKRELTSYEKYIAFRGVLPVESGPRGEVGPTLLPVTWRERQAILALKGSKCKRCGIPQYPRQRICINPECKAIDEMEDYRFSDRECTLFTYTEDYLTFTLNPPQTTGMIDFEEGGRFVFDITDCEAGSLKIGMQMEMTFRKKYADEVRGIHGYFWKAMPIRE